MFLNCTRLMREVALAAIAQHKDLNLQAGALLRRLGHSEKQTKDALGVNAYLQSAFDGAGLEDTEKTIEISTAEGARQMLKCLELWGSGAVKKDASVHQFTLITDIDVRKSAAQNMADALSEQLSLPMTDIAAFGAKKDGKKEPKAAAVE